MVWPGVSSLGIALAIVVVVGVAVTFAVTFAGWPPPVAALVTFILGVPLALAAGVVVAAAAAGWPPAGGLVTVLLLFMLAIAYDRVAAMRRIRTLSATTMSRADRDIHPGPGRRAVLELQRMGYEPIGAFLIPTGDGRSFPLAVLRSEDGGSYAEVIGSGCSLTSSFGALRLTTSRNSAPPHPARFLRQRGKGGAQKVTAAHAGALALLAGRHTEPRCLSAVAILDEIEADTHEICRHLAGMTFVEHVVSPLKTRRATARLDRDPRAEARIERWLESGAATV